MSHHRWELLPMGSIPHEVLSILLGSLPKVPDPKQEEEALERQYSTHDDRLSDDEEDEDTRRSGSIIGDHRLHNRVPEYQTASTYSRKSPTLEEDPQKSWQVPDDEWAWSDEEPSSATSKSTRPTMTTPTSKHGSTLSPPSKIQRNTHTGLGLIDKASEQSDTKQTIGSTLSNLPTSISPVSSLGDKSTVTPIGNHTASHPLSVAQDLYISMCDSGQYMACASKRMFAILQRQIRPTASRSPTSNLIHGCGSSHSNLEWVLVGQGSGVESPFQVYVVLGYKSGMIRIFNECGQLVVIQQLHHTPVVSIKTRVGAGRVPGEDEDEMTILHEDGKVVCIEGESLWVVLRLSGGSSRLSDTKSVQASQAPTFAYKKWSLQNQDLMVDVISCGPARHKPTLSNGFSSSSSSSMYTSQATERFIAVGSKPMMAFYASCSSSRPLFSATSLATQMAARVTNAVFGFAKSFWGSQAPRPGSPAFGGVSGGSSPDQKRISSQGIQDGTAGPYGIVYPSAMAPATEVPAVLWLSDSQRCIRHVSLAPAPPRGCCYHFPSKLAAMTDSLGRVLLVDLEECEIIRMWKGLRGARCGWLQEERIVKVGSGTGEVSTKRHLILYLVIYAPKRGTAEIYPARQGKRVGFIQVGLGWKVCTTFASPIGKPAVLDRIPGAPKVGAPAKDGTSNSAASSPALSHSSSSSAPRDQASVCLAQCILIGPTGEVRRVGSRLADSSNANTPVSNTTCASSSNSLSVSPTISSINVATESIASRLQALGTS
ncbi:Rab3 GTPase-activating protein non-catalytic subunit [Mortierella polycephala]|uniref:Rab3 GTPase-activating protein non-catalytic subunit n=1 Tax=Mortierella polycephala TaxID=41804 RepID=A0A9P6TX14_9FUNG|nr:Rab3 GTPase-activating protein non-catalytic subunit [Mortierella polycephala]